MAYLYNRFAKWVENNSSWVQMTWWKTNFNMPVPDLWGDTSWWVEWAWPFIYHWQATSFDLSWFNNWWELLVAISWLHRENWEWTWNTHTLKQSWRNPINDIMFENVINFTYETTWASEWKERQLWSNQWVAPWEVSSNWVYSCVVSVSWPDLNLSTTYSFTITWHPGFSGYETPGYIWVEWTDLCYISANGFIHRITWTSEWNVWASSAWHIWTNNSVIAPVLYYIDQSWEKRTTPWNLQQFPSSFSNWPTSTVSWQTPWYLYADNEFWWTHLSHIWWDGYKYLLWDWHYPYQDPY